MPATLLGSPNTRAHTPEMLLEGLREIFHSEYPLHDSGILETIFTVQGSRKEKETSLQTAGVGVAIPASEGASPTYDNLQEVYKVTATHVLYKLALEFTQESIEDNLYWNLVSMAGKELATAMAYTRQVQAWSFFNDLTEDIYSAGGTDYQLLETSHFRVDGGTWSNTPAVATGLSMAALEERLQSWTIGMLDQRGRKYMFRPKFLMVGAGNEFLADRLLLSEMRAEENSNNVNAVRKRKLTPFVNPHLTDDGRWFLIADKTNQALRYYDRIKARIEQYDGGDTGNRKFVARMRNSKILVTPSGISGSAGS